MEKDVEAIRAAYIQGGIDAITKWVEGYEMGQEAAKQIYK